MGPSFAIFCLGIFFPSSNAIGVMTGFVVGQLACGWIIVGSLFNKKGTYVLETSTEGCFTRNLTNVANKGLPVDSLKYYRMPIYSPKNFNRIYHLSHFIVPLVGFLVSLIVGLIVSQFFYDKNATINPDLLSTPFKKYKNGRVHERAIKDRSKKEQEEESIPLK